MRSKLAQGIITKFSNWLSREPLLKPAFLYDFDKIRFEIRPCDVLLVEGRNRISNIIKQVTHSMWSHSALYIGRLHDIDDLSLRAQVKKYYKGPPDEQLLIESIMGRGTIVTPLARYKDYNIRICRPSGLARDDAQKVIGYSINHLGMRYSLRHVIDLFRFLFPWGILPRRWRSTLFVHNALKPTEEICSSLIASAFQHVHFPILPEIIEDKEGVTLVSRNPKLFTPKDFDFSPFFDIIKYPMLPLIGEGMYQHLPWEADQNSGTEFIRIKNHDQEQKPNKLKTHHKPLVSLIPKVFSHSKYQVIPSAKNAEHLKEKKSVK